MNANLNEMMAGWGGSVVEWWLQSTLLLTGVLLLLPLVRRPAVRRVLARGALVGLGVLPFLGLAPAWTHWSPSSLLVDRTNTAPPSPHDVTTADPLDANSQIFDRRGRAWSVAGPVAESRSAPRHDDAEAASTAPLEPTGESRESRGDRTAYEAGRQTKARGFLPPLPASWRVAVAWLTLTAILLMLAWNVWGAWLAGRLVRSAQAAPPWLCDHYASLAPGQTSVRLLVSDRVRSAMIVGWVRPVILIPRDLLAGGLRPAVDAVLRHERAHLENGDFQWLHVERIVQLAYATQPLLPVLRRRLRMDQELLADAAAAGDTPLEYAEALVEWVKVATGPAPSSAVTGLASGHSFRLVSRRLTMLLESPQLVRSNVTWLGRVGIAVLLLALVGSASFLSLRPADSTAQERVSKRVADGASTPPTDASQRVPQKSQGRGATASVERTAGPTAAPQVICEIVAIRLDRAALAKFDESLEDRIIDASEERCRLERRAIIAPMRSARFAEFLKQLQAADAATVLGRPRVVATLDRPDTVRMGNDIPLVEVREFDGVAGQESPPNLVFRPVGLQLEITVRRPSPEAALQVDFVGVHSVLATASSATSDVPVINHFRMQLTEPLALGETLVILSRDGKPARDGVAAANSRQDLLFAVTLVELIVPPSPSAASQPDSADAPASVTAERRLASPTTAVGEWQSFLPHAFPLDRLSAVVPLKWQGLCHDSNGAERLIDCESSGLLVDPTGLVLAMFPLAMPAGQLQLRAGAEWQAAQLVRQDRSTGLALLKLVQPTAGFPGKMGELSWSHATPRVGDRVVLPGTRGSPQRVVSTTVEFVGARRDFSLFQPISFFQALSPTTDQASPLLLLRIPGRDSGPVFSEKGELIGLQIETILPPSAAVSSGSASDPGQLPWMSPGPRGLVLPAAEVVQALGRLLEATHGPPVWEKP